MKWEQAVVVSLVWMPSTTYGLHKLGISGCTSFRILTDLYECFTPVQNMVSKFQCWKWKFLAFVVGSLNCECLINVLDTVDLTLSGQMALSGLCQCTEKVSTFVTHPSSCPEDVGFGIFMAYRLNWHHSFHISCRLCRQLLGHYVSAACHA